MATKRTKQDRLWAEFDAAVVQAGPDIDRSGVLDLPEPELMELADRATRESRARALASSAPARESEADTLRRELRDAEAAGVDVSMVRQAARQTPIERISSNDDALVFFASVLVTHNAAPGSPDLGPRVEALYQRMQRPEVRDATERALQANPEDTGVSAVRADTRET